jgi:hypothetical protein
VPLGILIPVAILGSLLLLLVTVGILSRVAGGRYLRPIAMVLAKVGFIRRSMQKMSINHLEKTNPELASAMKKLQTFGEPTNVEAAQRAMRVLTPAERKAYMDAVGEQTAEQAPENRQFRRKMEHGGAGMPMRPKAAAPARPGAAGRRAGKKKK